MVETSGYWTWLSVVGEPRSRIVHHHRVEGFKRDRFLMPFGLLDPSLALSSNRRIFSLQRSRFRSIRVTKKLLFQFSFFSFFLFCDVFSNETWSCWIDEEEGRKKGNSYLYLDYLGRFWEWIEGELLPLSSQAEKFYTFFSFKGEKRRQVGCKDCDRRHVFIRGRKWGIFVGSWKFRNWTVGKRPTLRLQVY